MSLQINTKSQPKTTQNGISVLSLDALKPNEKLAPGEPHQLATGVTVSIMQSAAEALLEIEEAASGTISVDNLPAAELATVRPGQVIKTKEGRYVLIRHLQSIIVPREPGYMRPVHVEQMLQLAMEGLASEPKTKEPMVTPRTQEKSANSLLTRFFAKKEGGSENKSKLRMIILGVAAAGMIGLCFLPTDPENSAGQVASAPAIQHSEKSRVVAVSDPASTALPLNQATTPTAESSAKSEEKAKEPAPADEKHVSAVDALKGALAPVNPAPKKREKVAQKADADAVGGSRLVRLSEKDRQTVIEYKLEAKFDRSRARIKLKDFAQTFPVGSPARAEVEKAVSGM